jgi:uncharacterized membrane protein YdfJ with MMPL/SSD domain
VLGRLAALAVDRRRGVLLAAGVVFALALAFGLPATGTLKSSLSDFQASSSQYERANSAIRSATGQTPYYGVVALIGAGRAIPDDPAAARAVAEVTALLARQRGFQRALDYPATRSAALLSRDRRHTVVLAAFASAEDSASAVARVRAHLAHAASGAAGAGVSVRWGGIDVEFDELDRDTRSDLARAELYAFPILLGLSLLIFGGLIAAFLPLLVGGFGIALSLAVLRVVDQVVGVSIFSVNLVSGVGLGLGIDYSLFVLARYREELSAGAQPAVALERTMQTAGRTVLYSALTVAAALLTLLVFPLRFLYSMGIGGAAVALLDAAVALLVLPAALIALGPRLDALSLRRRPPHTVKRGLPGRLAARATGGFWGGIARRVMRRPGPIAAVTAAGLLALATPVLHLALAPPGTLQLPASSQGRQVAEAISREFAGDPSAAVSIVARAPAVPAGAAPPASVHALAAAAAQTARGQAVVLPGRHLGGDTWEVQLLPHGAPQSAANQQLVRDLRARLDPSGALVGGYAAFTIDERSTIASGLPIVLPILVLLTVAFLFAMTASATIAALALAANLLTATFAAGVLVLVFQDGHLLGLLDARPIGGLEEANLVLLIMLTWALSTDYGVFLLARIKEAHDHGLDSRAAAVHGIERTGRLITFAALLFCIAVGAYASSQIFFVKQLGVGAAAAVAIDATVVRALLLPAAIGLLGERAWWAPHVLCTVHGRARSRLGALHPDGASRDGETAPSRHPVEVAADSSGEH